MNNPKENKRNVQKSTKNIPKSKKPSYGDLLKELQEIKNSIKSKDSQLIAIAKGQKEIGLWIMGIAVAIAFAFMFVPINYSFIIKLSSASLFLSGFFLYLAGYFFEKSNNKYQDFAIFLEKEKLIPNHPFSKKWKKVRKAAINYPIHKRAENLELICFLFLFLSLFGVISWGIRLYILSR